MESSSVTKQARVVVALGLVGFLWALYEAIAGSFPIQDGDGYSMFATALLFVIVPLVVRFAFRTGWRAMREYPGLLRPYAVLLLVHLLLGKLALLPFVVASEHATVLGIGFTISVYVVLLVLAAIFYAAWMTRILLDRTETGSPDVGAGLGRALRQSPRVALFMVVGVVGLLLPCGVVISTGLVGVAAVLIPLWAFAWNGLTAAFLPSAMTAPTIREAFASAFRAARQPAIWGIVALHLVLIGTITYFSVTRTVVTEKSWRMPDGGLRRETTRTTHSNTGTHVEGVWTGAYESDFHWHGKLMAKAVKSREWPLATFLLGFLAAALAIVIKVEVIRRLPIPRAPPDMPSV